MREGGCQPKGCSRKKVRREGISSRKTEVGKKEGMKERKKKRRRE